MQNIIDGCLQCSKCGQWKPLTDLVKDCTLPSGRRSTCYECHRVWARGYRYRRYHTDAAYRDRQRAAVRHWQKAQAVAYNAYQRRYRAKKKASEGL